MSSTLYLHNHSPYCAVHPIEWPTINLQSFCKCAYRELAEFEDVRRLQNSHGIHVCVSEREGFGHYINEARAVGALVVTTNHPPMNELITEETGVLVQPYRTRYVAASPVGLL